MKVPLSWLRKYLPLENSDLELICDSLTLCGLEVEKVDGAHFVFSGVVVAKVESVAPHPDADKLQIATVFDGSERYQVVCGAPNCIAGIVIPFAKLGAELPGLTITKRKVRGVESFGMLCGADELQLDDGVDGLMLLPLDAPLGKDLASYLMDPILDITLTPNLGYCRSMIGIGRELAAQLNKEIDLEDLPYREESSKTSSSVIQVTNSAPDNCFQYYCRVMEGIQVAPSPLWLQESLKKAGYNSINNIVDAINFIMHETGQPMHAFDGDKIAQSHLIIRGAKAEETILTLDGVMRALPEGTLVIADPEQILAIGGVMGGESSKVDENTKNIVLEAAQFDSSSVRKTSRALGLRSESSARFENGIDPDNLQRALNRAVALIQEIAGGRILHGCVDQSPISYKPRFLACRASRINGLLGLQLSMSEIESYLARLGFHVTVDNLDLFQVRVPSWRDHDVKEEIDLVEEVARVFGYNNIPRTPPRHVNAQVAHHPLFLLEREIREWMVRSGLQEFLTCNLISPAIASAELDSNLFGSEYIKVLHPKSEDQSILRPSLLPGLIAAVKHNQNHGTFDIHAFELGRIHYREKGTCHEKLSLGIILAGERALHHWSSKQQARESTEVDFYDLKGIIENLFTACAIPDVEFTPSSFQSFHPGRQASIKSGALQFGVMGEIHPTSLQTEGVRKRVLFAEIDLHLLKELSQKTVQFTLLPQFPSSVRDWTIALPQDMPLSPLLQATQHATKSGSAPLLKGVELLDIYIGERAEPGKKNVSFRFTYQSDNTTLDFPTIEKEHEKVIARLIEVFS